MITTKNPGIMEAIKEIKQMSLSRRFTMRCEAHMKEVRDLRAQYGTYKGNITALCAWT